MTAGSEFQEKITDWDLYWKNARAYFELHGPAINSFAIDHGLHISEFERESTTWDLMCKHPKGGWFTIFIGLSNYEKVRVSACWSISVFESYSKYSKEVDFINDYTTTVNLLDWLEKAFRNVMLWKVEELSVVYREGYFKDSWAKYTSKEAWESRFISYPQNYPKGYDSLPS